MMTDTTLIREYDELIEALRARKAAMGVTDREFEAVTGLATGHLAKIIGDAPAKSIGPVSFSKLLWGLKVAIVIVDDPAPVDFTFEPRLKPPPSGKHVSRAALERARPILEPVVIQELGRRGGRNRTAMLSASHRSEWARHAAKKRWKGHKVPAKKRGILARAAQRARERRRARQDTLPSAPAAPLVPQQGPQQD